MCDDSPSGSAAPDSAGLRRMRGGELTERDSWFVVWKRPKPEGREAEEEEQWKTGVNRWSSKHLMVTSVEEAPLCQSYATAAWTDPDWRQLASPERLLIDPVSAAHQQTCRDQNKFVKSYAKGCVMRRAHSDSQGDCVILNTTFLFYL